MLQVLSFAGLHCGDSVLELLKDSLHHDSGDGPDFLPNSSFQFRDGCGIVSKHPVLQIAP